MPLLYLAAGIAAVIVAAAPVAAVVAAAAAAEQQDQNDDPPPVVTHVIVAAHNIYLQISFERLTVHVPWYDRRGKMCETSRRDLTESGEKNKINVACYVFMEVIA
jgi:hypothetical protein